MTVRTVHLSRPIALVAAEGDADPAPALREVDQLAAQGILPATLDRDDDGGWRMALYTAAHVVWLRPTEEQDAFVLDHTEPQGFGAQARLVRGALLLRATFHQLSVRDPLPGQQLWREWESLPAQDAGRDRAHSDYLDLLDLGVQALREIEIARHRAMAPQRYVSRAHAGGGVYSFQLTRPGVLTANTVVCVGEAPELRGRVIRGYGRMVTAMFPADTDQARIRTQGTLLTLPSDRIHAARREAVARLRAGTTRNPALLGILVGQGYGAYEPRHDMKPERALDADQLGAFQRALGAPDVLNVLGPPGTGKTTTIAEVVDACVRQGQRVLVTSPTHRGVDAVLENLAPGLEVVRVGAEDSMGAKVRAAAAQSRAQAARRQILADTSVLDTLTEMLHGRPVLEWHLAHLHTQLQIVQSASEELVATQAAIEDALKRAEAALRAQLAQAERDSVRQQSILASTEAGLTRSYQSAIDSQGRADSGKPLAFAYRWHANHQRRRSERLAQVLPTAKAASEKAKALRARLRDEFETLVAQDPLVLELRATHDRAQRALTAAWPEIRSTGKVIREMLSPADCAPDTPPDTAEGWAAFHTACVATLSTLERRRALLGDWHRAISDPATDLEPELTRYADVVAVTCLGSDASAVIAEHDFDLAIVDDAGQVTLPDLLLPLVGARRALLVGDHIPPPPLPREEIQRWAGGVTVAKDEAEGVTALLAASGFELLFTRAPEPNAIWLQTQRRIPRQIAEFASATCYGGRLRSAYHGASRDPHFSSPFAMVNTADRPAGDDSLIAQLVTQSHRHYRDWSVIMPDHARQEAVIARLQQLLGPAARVAENVSLADTILAPETDLIILAFPFNSPSPQERAGPQGGAGMALWPRRVGAAIMRARRQLVLVGDIDKLRVAAEHQGWQDFLDSLLNHLKQHGDLRDSVAIEQAPGATAEQQS